MSYIPLPDKTTVRGKVLKLLEDAEKRWGYLPNICRAYALAPEVMLAEDVWSKGVMYKGLLPRSLKEAIATVVSATNNCNYCASSHAHAYTLAGGNAKDAAACKRINLDEFDDKERRALEFAYKATADCKAIRQNDIDELKKHFSYPEIVEIATVIQQFMGYNWFVTILGLELEEQNPMKNIGLVKEKL